MKENYYLVTNQAEDREAFKRLSNSSILGLDTETSGLSFVDDSLWSIQISNKELSYLYVVNGEDRFYPFLAQLLKNKDILKVAHNMSFDMKFLWKAGYEINGTWCSYVAENILECGKYSDGNYGLKPTIERRLKIELDKSIRKDFYQVYLKKPSQKNPLGVLNPSYFGINKEWTQERIEYALDDVKYLIDVYELQAKQTSKEMLDRTMYLEQELVPVTARMEYRGIRLDEGKLEVFRKKMEQKVNAYYSSISNVLSAPYLKEKAKEYKSSIQEYREWERYYKDVSSANNKREGRKLSEESKKAREFAKNLKPPKPKEVVELNLDSPAQLKEALNIVTRRQFESTDKKVLAPFANDYPVINDLLELSKYGELLKFCKIKEKLSSDNLLHPTFNQVGTVTGRYSSSDPNGQNIPARSEEGKEFRACFIPKEGYKFISADYSAIELIIIAVASGSTTLLEVLKSGKDLHLYTLSKMFRVSYDSLFKLRNDGKVSSDAQAFLRRVNETVYLRDLAGKSHKEFLEGIRDFIKTITYGLAYGLSSFGIAQKFNCLTSSADRLVREFFDVYPDIKRYLDHNGARALSTKSSINMNGRRRYFNTSAISLQKARELSTASLRISAMAEARKEESRILRQGSNYPIQSTCADIIKLAMLLFDNKLRKNGMSGDEGIVLSIHDEIVAAIKEENVPIASEYMASSMANAATQILGSDVEFDVKVKVSDCWEK